MATKNKVAEEGLDKAQGKLIQLITFRLANRLLGVDIMDVKEVCDNISITPIKHAPEKVCGYMNIRGQILLVVDLRTEFGFEGDSMSEGKRVVVFKESVDEPFGILVDTVEDVVEIFEGQITDRRAGELETAVDASTMEKRKANSTLCDGVCPLDNELVLLLNSRGILDGARKA